MNEPGVLKMRIGDVEIVHANPDVLRMLEKIIDQHNRMLEMHAQLIKGFCSPPILVARQAAEEKYPETPEDIHEPASR